MSSLRMALKLSMMADSVTPLPEKKTPVQPQKRKNSMTEEDMTPSKQRKGSMSSDDGDSKKNVKDIKKQQSPVRSGRDEVPEKTSKTPNLSTILEKSEPKYVKKPVTSTSSSSSSSASLLVQSNGSKKSRSASMDEEKEKPKDKEKEKEKSKPMDRPEGGRARGSSVTSVKDEPESNKPSKSKAARVDTEQGDLDVDHVDSDDAESSAEPQAKRRKKGSRNTLLEEAAAFSNGVAVGAARANNLVVSTASDNKSTATAKTESEDQEQEKEGGNGDGESDEAAGASRARTPRSAALVAKTKLSVKNSWSNMMEQKNEEAKIAAEMKEQRDRERSGPPGSPGSRGGRGGRGGRVGIAGRGSGGGRWAGHVKGSQSAAAAETAAVAADVDWVQCDKCQKWRTLPAHISSNSLPDNWECSMNTWNNKNRCSVAEEVSGDGDGAGEDLAADGTPRRTYHRKGGGAGGRKTVQSTRDSGGVEVTANWIECTKCQKWRVVPPNIDSSKFPNDWECSSTSWPSKYFYCEAPEEVLPEPGAGGTLQDINFEGESAARGRAGGGAGRGAGAGAKGGKAGKQSLQNVAQSSSAFGIERTVLPDGTVVEKSVVRWVQCERKNCKKWRKVPPHVDMRGFPEKWYCEMNTWDLDRANCENDEESDSETENSLSLGGSYVSGNTNQLSTPGMPSSPGSSVTYGKSSEAGFAAGTGGKSSSKPPANVNQSLIMGNSKGLNTLSYRRIIFTADGKIRPAFSEKNKNGYGTFSYSGSSLFGSNADKEDRKSRDDSEYTEPLRKMYFWSSSAAAVDGDRKSAYANISRTRTEADARKHSSKHVETHYLLDTIGRLSLSGTGTSVISKSTGPVISEKGRFGAHKLVQKSEHLRSATRKSAAMDMTLYGRMKLECAVIRSILLVYNKKSSLHRVKLSKLNRAKTTRPARRNNKRSAKSDTESGSGSDDGSEEETTAAGRPSGASSSPRASAGAGSIPPAGGTDSTNTNTNANININRNGVDNSQEGGVVADRFSSKFLTDTVVRDCTVVGDPLNKEQQLELLVSMHYPQYSGMSFNLLKHYLSISSFQHNQQLEAVRLALLEDNGAVCDCLRVLEQRCEVQISVNKVNIDGIDHHELFVSPCAWDQTAATDQQECAGGDGVGSIDTGPIIDDGFVLSRPTAQFMKKHNPLQTSAFNQYCVSKDTITPDSDVVTKVEKPTRNTSSLAVNSGSSSSSKNAVASKMLPLKMRKYQ